MFSFSDNASGSIRSSNRLSGLQNNRKNTVDTSDIVINKEDDPNTFQFEESYSDDCYSSPGYVPHSTYQKDSDFQLSDDINDIIQRLPCSPTNTETNVPVTDVVKTILKPVNVERASKQLTNDKKLIRDKKVYCIYCDLLVSNFPRHLERKHAFETDVRLIITLPKKSKERLKHLELIKNKGNLYYNRTILDKNEGTIIVGRRPKHSEEVNVIDYLPCKHCFKFFKKKKLYRHANRCLFQEKSSTDNIMPRKRNKMMQSAMLLNTSLDFKQLNGIFSSMKCDDISFIAQSDNLICSFGARLIQNHRENHLLGYISQRMRQLSRFLIILRSLLPELTNLKDFFEPKYYNTVVEAAKQLSGYNEEKNTYLYPTVAMKIGHSIIQCVDILESQLIIQDASEEELQKVKKFSSVFQKEWKFSISSNVNQDINKKKFNKSVALPDTKDITLLHTFLTYQLSTVINEIKNGNINLNNYKIVCQTLLTQIILLNRRRSGEVERIKLLDYLNRDKTKIQEDVQKSLTDVEVRLSKSFVRFVIRGKRGRGVPVLLTSTMKESLDILIQIRISCNVFESNEYIFAIPFTLVGVYRGSDCLRKAAIDCNASSPELLTSTKLRKHIATMSQLLNLTSNDKEQLANFMGHDLAIHNNYYKLPDETLQISRISKILLAMESGHLHELRDKTLEKFDDYLIPNTLTDSSEDEEMDGNLFIYNDYTLCINN